MIERTATIHNSHGIHCRPSAVIVQAANQYSGRIQILAESGQTDLRSLLALVSLGLEAGDNVRIRVSGPDEERLCDRLVELFERRFDFPPLYAEDRANVVDDLIGEDRRHPR